MFIRLIIIATFFISSMAYANPAPLGLEIGKATAEDVKKNFKVISDAPNATSGYYNYHIDSNSVDMDGVSKMTVICDESQVVSAVLLTMGKSKFVPMANMLLEKYQETERNIPHVGNKYIIFKDGDCEIILRSPHMSFDMTLDYVRDTFVKAFDIGIAAEEAAKKSKEKSML